MAADDPVRHGERIAVFGGDGRLPSGLVLDGEVDVFRSPRDGGSGDYKRLLKRLRQGAYDRVIILTRWNSHVATKKVVKACKRLGIQPEPWPPRADQPRIAEGAP